MDLQVPPMEGRHRGSNLDHFFKHIRRPKNGSIWGSIFGVKNGPRKGPRFWGVK